CVRLSCAGRITWRYQPNDRKRPPVTTALQLDERYGRTRRKRAPWIIVGVLALVAVVALSWVTISQTMNTVDVDDLGFEVVDEHSVSVSFQITGKPGSDVVCALEALDEEFGVVGWKIVELPATQSHAQRLS